MKIEVNVCPMCGTKTNEVVCPNCYTRIPHGQSAHTPAPNAEGWRYISMEEMRTLPPFTCPKCAGRSLMISNAGRYRCGTCGVFLTVPKQPIIQIPRPQQEPPQPELSTKPEESVENTSAALPETEPAVIPTLEEVRPQESALPSDLPPSGFDPEQTIPGFTLPQIEGEEPSATAKAVEQMENEPIAPPKPEPEFAPLPEKPKPVKVKKGSGKGGLIAVLCGIMLLFLIGTGIAVAVDGFVDADSLFDSIVPSMPDIGEDPFSDIPGFDEDIFSGIPGFEDFFSDIPGFDGDTSSTPENDPFGKTEGDPFGEETDDPLYPNGCSKKEFEKLENGMTYGQISAIIGGDAANFYDTTDKGEQCTVFQWVTENDTGYISVKFVDGRAVDFYAGEYQ